MSSRQLTRLTFSFETLAAHGGRTAGYRDGGGAAFYRGNEAVLFFLMRMATHCLSTVLDAFNLGLVSVFSLAFTCCHVGMKMRTSQSMPAERLLPLVSRTDC